MTAQVLVVGAGPTGLTMALELARRSVTVRIVDAATAPTTETRALGVQPRTLELFEKLQLADASVARGVPVTEFNVFSEGKRFLHLDIHALDTPHPYLLMVPQPQVEALLSGRLAEHGVTVEHGVELSTLTHTPDDVRVGLRHRTGLMEQTRAPWVIGCDGAHSIVRRQLGVPFVGAAFEENFAVADVQMDWSLPYDVFYSFLNRGRFVAFFPMPGGLHRLTIAYRPRQSPVGEVTFEELQSAVERCAPAGARISEITHAGRFRINQRKVARHSVGRVYLAGDAAHVHSVVGGQGMNTGIQDAFNLGWKLAAVVHGQAAPEILDSYAVERSPVAHRLVKGTRRATRMTLLRNPIAAAARRHLAPHITARPAVQRIVERALTQLDVSYRGRTGGTNDTRLAVGDRFPHISVLDSSRFTLLHSGPEPLGLHAAIGPHAELIDVRHDTAQAGCAGLTLVRPDGYLALLDCSVRELRDYLGRTFTPPAAGEHTAATG
ncbi:FAD-dependent monooxygenase [Mycolicibacterium lutetiense]|jgi:2-polyprenyl-6-methoxyphenol hydroxylase-like FAD-dependent oxidoreductase|uniref:2-polyprenyl-6-methoxyphenol hydroxylase-like FAD-dependent oxidoreductase n=1 Tax=Mycolicibacterium lutetiense TaxID=1641992 RepID=A0ABS4ZV98_9MYCO|nr:FAD-dependent monooxygenase [Mycolicibacterium lutetiense]MBP2453432.1 2-polyprenyl-6-methoxyphenol hydroxylase-like FAD-dependent oxidoreductase [Mycolicibacterium lutetiense]